MTWIALRIKSDLSNKAKKNIRCKSNTIESNLVSQQVSPGHSFSNKKNMGKSNNGDDQPPARRVDSRLTSTALANPTAPTFGLVDYICGVISGVGKVVVGYPFDTVKARVQTGRFPTSWSAVKGTLRHEGVFAFYQGVSMPAATVCFVGGIMFYVNAAIRRVLQPDHTIPLTYGQMLAAGSGAGLAVGLVLTPMEVVKVRLQVANRNSGGHSSVKDVMKVMRVRDYGAGFVPTVIREICTFGLFFPVNEYCKVTLKAKRDEWFPQRSGSGMPFWIRVLAAGIGGIVGWLPCYPVDVIKSRMQVAPQGTYRTWIHCGIDLYRREGHRAMYKGLPMCLVRAFPAYAAQFLLYEQVRDMLA